ncbi:hypothetical protein GCM10010112_58240 [Actinoplanes lobatus]|uniref:AAA+ ATPase domain-containing protein n=1 Tax=Actinoplanes lobatus TaxID=113568 RepID=A0A7W7HQJ3_9ACTN|nr:AAA family ATPase [Actinoplanes lobatus]MBB4754825.1 hypothetical protein [Actinoplanes lobatus]GGN81605.1 hypothetical protein GCM10010112_58240 [Actinoplanes lobatus]GIE43045.1 hypothetical protein Alo02nite_59430 [Actinoplanes lobatus]
MPKALSYAQAVRILGKGSGAESMRRLNDLTGGALLGASVTTATVLQWFDAYAVFARLSQQLAGTVGQRLVGAHRLDRTERIAAAHTVIVIAAWFDALNGADLPFDTSALGITADDQLRLTDAGAKDRRLLGPAVVRGRDLAGAVLQTGVHLPEPHGPRQNHRARLRSTYQRLAGTVNGFLRGLAVWDELSPGEEERVDRELADIPDRALVRYERMLLDLRADCPEADLWVRDWDTGALLESVRDIHQLMRSVAGPATAAEVPRALARAYAGLLDRPVVGTGERTADVDMPTLRRAYLPSLFRAMEAVPDQPASDERFWADVPVRGDLHKYLTGYLTSPRAQTAPLVVLGQPGAGKSVLTKVLAAELAEGGFVPVRVSLREVDTALGLQRQIEQAVLDATGEAIAWPRLAETADRRLPVVLLDGFDELLQATATSQSDYLDRVADFQQREQDQGRAVAVVVTTRTSVADRAVPPPDTLLLRLEPFDAQRVSAWLDVWHAANSQRLAARGLHPLPAEVAMRFPELAGQPLLLLLLALYDAGDNALQHTGELSPSDLYERLLTSFARREVRKGSPNLSAAQCDAEAERELRRLSVVAFGMLNRSAQWITEPELERDLMAVFGTMPGSANGGIDAAGLLLGRFFFVHRAQAVRASRTLATYEFLHGSFGEYLVARFTWQLLQEAVSRLSVAVSPTWNADDGLFSRLLSFVPLAIRSLILRFLAEFSAGLTEKQSAEWLAAVIGMYRRSQYLTWGSQSGEYRPVTVRMPLRYAAYTANLVVLAVLVAGGELDFRDIAEPEEASARKQWHDQSLLWHSQLGGGDAWDAITLTLAADQCRDPDGERDLRLRFVADGTAVSRTDELWLFGRDGDREYGRPFGSSFTSEAMVRHIRFQSCSMDSLLLHALQPVLESSLAPAMQLFSGHSSGDSSSIVQGLFRVWLLPLSRLDDEERQAAYEECAFLSPEDFRSWDATAYGAYVTQLLAAVRADVDLPVGFAGALVQELETSSLMPFFHEAIDVTIRVLADRAGGRDKLTRRIAEWLGEV